MFYKVKMLYQMSIINDTKVSTIFFRQRDECYM